MPVTIGGLTADRVPDLLDALGGPFFFDVPDDELEDEVTHFTDVNEVDRLRCAFDGDTIVGTLGGFSLDMTVPGGSIRCGGTTIVTVQPTHRRQGVLRRMIDAHFEDVREREEPIAALFASDSAIYGRFGYGIASVSAEISIDRSHGALHRLAPEPRPVRLVPADGVAEILAPVFERAHRSRPGMFPRNDAWWRHQVRDRKEDRDGATAFRYAVVDGPDGPDGYVQYRVKPGRWSTGHGDGIVQVNELIALDEIAAASLWSFLLGQDLIASVDAWMLPVDDPVFDLLAGWRRARPRLNDELWVRILDVDRALSGRTYQRDGSVSFRIHDPVTGEVANHRLEVDHGVGTSTTAADGEIELDIEDLGACFLGRARFRSLARAGRMSGSAEALAMADQMFEWDPAPWCQQVF